MTRERDTERDSKEVGGTKMSKSKRDRESEREGKMRPATATHCITL